MVRKLMEEREAFLKVVVTQNGGYFSKWLPVFFVRLFIR